MNIGIVVATQEEFDSLLPLIEYPYDFNYGKKKFTSGGYQRKHHITLGLSGIGKVNSAITTSAMIETFHPELIINTGCSGADDKQVNVGDIIIGVRYKYHDVDCRLNDSIKINQIPGSSSEFIFGLGPTQFDTELLKQKVQEKKISVYEGTIYTGDSFTESIPTNIDSNDYGFHAYDMECAASAQVCELHKIPFASYKIISNNYVKLDQIRQFHDFWKDNSVTLLEFTKLYLDSVSTTF